MEGGLGSQSKAVDAAKSSATKGARPDAGGDASGYVAVLRSHSIRSRL